MDVNILAQRVAQLEEENQHLTDAFELLYQAMLAKLLTSKGHKITITQNDIEAATIIFDQVYREVCPQTGDVTYFVEEPILH